ncbi:MAG TPA: hypothetical protein VF252_12975 [Gemmatimonadales bacterium]
MKREIKLLAGLEDRFGLSLPMENLELDDLRSAGRIAGLIGRMSVATLGRVAEG